MKTKLFLNIFLILTGMTLYAQQGINYKAVLTDNGNIIQNQQVTLRFSILENGTTLIYEEAQTKTTDINGIVLANIGEGTVNFGSFASINWGNPQSLKVEVNIGSGYNDMGTTQMKYVPYAKFATKALDANDQDFYKSGTSIKATANTDDIYHMGKVGIGSTTYDAQLQVSTTSSLYGISTGHSTISSFNTSGLQNVLSGNGTGSHVGTENDLTGAGSGIQYGTFNWIDNSGNSLHYGIRNTLSGTGSGIHRGTYNELLGTGTGEQVGSYQNIYNTNNATHYGVNNELTGSGGGDHFGIKNSLSGNGTGTNYGEYNNLSGTGTGFQFGSYQNISVSGEGTHYGVTAYLNGSGTGTKYGLYSLISETAGGYHVALYAKATKTGSYAGYFVGDTYFNGKLTSNDSGDADMKAYIYGNVNSNGTVSNGCSAGFTVTRIVAGHYRITFTTSPGSNSTYVVVGAILSANQPRLLTYAPQNDYFDIYTWNPSISALDDCFFNFVVYKK